MFDEAAGQCCAQWSLDRRATQPRARFEEGFIEAVGQTQGIQSELEHEVVLVQTAVFDNASVATGMPCVVARVTRLDATLDSPRRLIGQFAVCTGIPLGWRAFFPEPWLARGRTMKDIHPAYHTINVTCTCGHTFETRSTLSEDLHIEVCSRCHPFFTGKQKIMDTGGRVDKFRRKYGLSA